MHEDGTSKPRPALLASTAAYAAEKNLVWAMKITTTERLDTDVIALDPAQPEWPLTGLRKACFLYVGKIQTIPPTGLIRKYGEIPPALAARVRDLMKSLTGLNIP